MLPSARAQHADICARAQSTFLAGGFLVSSSIVFGREKKQNIVLHLIFALFQSGPRHRTQKKNRRMCGTATRAEQGASDR